MNAGSRPSGFVQNLAIMASAGTGKTYQLAMRFISLLLAGAGPEEIAALTFSRKAAGEILEKIVSLLSELIRKEDKRCEAVKDGFIPPGTTPEQLSRVLRGILSCRNKLHIETNDSFLFQIIQAAPAEFGIRGEIAMADENDDRPRQRALLRTLHDPRFAGSGRESASRRNDIYQVLRDISFGKTRPTLYDELTELLKNHYRAFLNYPSPANWTLPDDRPDSTALLSSARLDDLRRQFDELLETAKKTDQLKDEKSFNKLVSLADCAEKVPADHFTWPDLQDASAILVEYEKIRKADPGLPDPPGPADTALWKFNGKDNTLNGPILEILNKWVRHLAVLEHDALRKKTQAVYKVMDLFDGSFCAQTRAAGKITFEDILFLINSKEKNDYGMLQVLQERLGMTVGHYLLDEFQDTSTAQWSAFGNLAEEAIQNVDPGRFTSFFMVGDIKQSIYQWRSGNPALFMKICREQGILPEEDQDRRTDRTAPGGLLKSLSCSFRSSTPVLRLVNDVFAPEKEQSFPARLKEQASVFAAQVGKMRFERHISGLREKDSPETGCSLVLTTPVSGGGDDELVMWRTICALIQKLDPFSKKRKQPLSVAVLFRKNDKLRSCYEAMRRFAPELSVSMEGTVVLEDSMAYAVFRQLLRYAAHPGDPAASAYLSMIRLADGSAGLNRIRERLFPREEECDLPQRIREELDQAGYGAFLQRFRDAFPETERESEYMDCLAAALASGEAAGPSPLSPDERIALLDKYRSPLKSMARTVQLMTIHKSKGLGFDIVIVPCVAESGTSERGGFVKDEENDRCYFAPNKNFIPLFPRIGKNARRRMEENLYELGCTVYVALTRAKRSTIVILPEEAGNSSAATLHFADILRRTGEIDDPSGSKKEADLFVRGLAPFFGGKCPPLTPVYCTGDPFWAERMMPAPRQNAEETAEPKPEEREKAFRDRLRAQAAAYPLPRAVFSRHPEREEAETAPPSFHSFGIQPGSRFLPASAADFGTCVHEILRELEWLGSEEETKGFLRRFSEEAPDAVRLLENALAKPDIADHLRSPGSAHVRLFREQPFLLRTGDSESPLGGVIDRASVEYDEAGIPVRAEILDYKTDASGDPEHFRTLYRRQLEIYRRAMSELTGLPEHGIACTILALRPGLAVSL